MLTWYAKHGILDGKYWKGGLVVAILFVDDEPHVLDGLRRMLRPWRHQWALSFATGGTEALTKLSEQVFDVVVSDMRMPGMDGAELLTAVAARSPQTVRMILSGQHDRDALFRALPITHGILAKPCDTELLVEAITRAVALRTRLSDERLRAAVNGLACLPSLPQIYQALIAELTAATPSLDRIAEVVEADPPLTAKLLQVANFPTFAGRAPLDSAGDAVEHLGIDLLKAILLQHGVTAQLPAATLDTLPVAALWERSVAAAALAQRIAASEGLSRHEIDTTVTAALLHETGALVIAVEDAPAYRQIIAAAQAGSSRTQAERERFGVTSPEVGAYLLALWGLAPTVVEAVALQADIEALGAHPPRPALILIAAAALASSRHDGWPAATSLADIAERLPPSIALQVQSWASLLSD